VPTSDDVWDLLVKAVLGAIGVLMGTVTFLVGVIRAVYANANARYADEVRKRDERHEKFLAEFEKLERRVSRLEFESDHHAGHARAET